MVGERRAQASEGFLLLFVLPARPVLQPSLPSLLQGSAALCLLLPFSQGRLWVGVPPPCSPFPLSSPRTSTGPLLSGHNHVERRCRLQNLRSPHLMPPLCRSCSESLDVGAGSWWSGPRRVESRVTWKFSPGLPGLPFLLLGQPWSFPLPHTRLLQVTARVTIPRCCFGSSAWCLPATPREDGPQEPPRG